jgi:hypothetical protein
MKKVYISGQITGLEIDTARVLFAEAEKILIEAEKMPVNPMKEVPFNKNYTWADYMSKDIDILLKCDGIFMLTNWVNSKGARIEHYIAKEIGLKIYYHQNIKSLPTDECVEQWWAEGQDQKKGFWQEAPYRTNGDVVEEIKTALKYFIETWQR